MLKDFENNKDFIDFTSPCKEWNTRKTGEINFKIQQQKTTFTTFN